MRETTTLRWLVGIAVAGLIVAGVGTASGQDGVSTPDRGHIERSLPEEVPPKAADPATRIQDVDLEDETDSPPPGFGAMVSQAARSGPSFPAECGTFGRWVSSQARGVECTPPPPDDPA